MSHNVKVLLIVSVLFGVASGLYEFVLPYYLDQQNLSFRNMGAIFAFSAAAMFFVRLGLGEAADAWSRKKLYLLALAGAAASFFITPLTASVWLLVCLKTLREGAFLTRETVHPILLYQENRNRFLDFIGKTKGMEFTFQATGTFLGGTALVALGSFGSFGIGGVVLLTTALLLAVGVHEQKRERIKPPDAKPGQIVTAVTRAKDLASPRQTQHLALGRSVTRSRGHRLATFFTWDIDRNLKIILCANFIFSIGLGTSHCFIMPLFFSQKFGVSVTTVATVMLIHRLTLGVPMLFAGRIPPQHFKKVYIVTVILEGLSMSLGGIIPHFFWASAVWLLHDLIGAGIWMPIQSAIIQECCREEERGRDLSKTLAFASLGRAIGPLLAGYLAVRSISAPFVASGLIVLLSVPPLVRLSLPQPTPGKE